MSKVWLMQKNGEMQATIPMTLNYKGLLKLRESNRELYDEYNRIYRNGVQEDLDNLIILYSAYVCACDDTPVSIEEFCDWIPDDRVEIGELVRKALVPNQKKKEDSLMLLKSALESKKMVK